MIIEQYELGKLESIILSDLAAFIERKYSVDHDLVVHFKKYVDSEVERIKFSFVNSTAALEKRRALEVFVQYHEQNIIRLAGSLTRYATPTKIHRPSQTDAAILCRYLYEGLQDLLVFIERHYPKYFDHRAWIPESYHSIVVTEITRNIASLKKGLLGKGFSPDLVLQVLSPYERFVKNKTSKYHRLIYLKQLHHELLILIEQPLSDKPDDIPLMWVLFDMNFNTVAYYHYVTQWMRTLLELTDDTKERVSTLTLAVKLMQQRVTRPEYAFDPDVQSIRDQLIQWCQLELTYYLGKLSGPDTTHESSDEPDTRVKVDLSVAQLAYFIRLLIEDGVLDQKNITPLIRKIARIFETKRSDTISAKSLENKYYDVESGTRQSIRTMLMDMVRRIDESK